MKEFHSDGNSRGWSHESVQFENPHCHGGTRMSVATLKLMVTRITIGVIR